MRKIYQNPNSESRRAERGEDTVIDESPSLGGIGGGGGEDEGQDELVLFDLLPLVRYGSGTR